VTLDLPDGSTVGLPTAEEGTTVTYTLHYVVGELSVHDGVITDVLPAKVEFQAGSATSNAEFTFSGYDAASRTLTWHAATVTAGGSVSYRSTVETGANAETQPRTNTATIASEETGPVSATSDIYVPVIPQGETNIPTPPPTDLATPTVPTSSGPSVMLLLVILGSLVATIGIATPIPAPIRRRTRR
jgi:uncharacterized repeat protein (TIGR01451 family)